MFSTYRSIAHHLKNQVSELKSIDRDKGQLENAETFESLVTPAALLDFSEIKWSGGTRGNQTGTGTLTVSLVFPLPASTRHGAEWNNYEQPERLTDKIYDSLALHKDVGDRRTGGDYFTGNFYVCTQAFDLKVYKDIAVKTMPKPFPDIEGNLQATINLPV